MNKTMVFGTSGGGMCTGDALPGAAIEVGVYPAGSGLTDTLNLTIAINGMTPQEAAPYNGHTVHPQGADVVTAEDGVPETGSPVNGDTYTWTPLTGHAGSYLYHCHVHTVKHLEMGMYGALVALRRTPPGPGSTRSPITRPRHTTTCRTTCSARWIRPTTPPPAIRPCSPTTIRATS